MEEQNMNTGQFTSAWHKMGFNAASKSSSHLSAVEGILDTVYNSFLKTQQLDEEGKKKRVTQLKKENEQEANKQNELVADIESKNNWMEEKREKIQELELERIDLRKGDSDIDSTSEIPPFIIASFITLLLTLYLFLFYSSTGFSVFYGIENGMDGFINSDVFSMAQDRGMGALIFVILFPVVFLAVGFALHTSLEKNKKLKKQKKRPKYLGIVMIFLITLIADSIIGYKISEGVHNNAVNMGLTRKSWKFEMIYSDINFYLVLILGFVVYVIWGVLLNYVLSHPYLKSYSEKTKLLLENLEDRIQTQKNDLKQIVDSIHQLEGKLKNTETKMAYNRSLIHDYEADVIPVDTALLSSAVSKFMMGWQTFTTNAWGNTVQTRKHIEEALKTQENWLNTKISSLKSLKPISS